MGRCRGKIGFCSHNLICFHYPSIIRIFENRFQNYFVYYEHLYRPSVKYYDSISYYSFILDQSRDDSLCEDTWGFENCDILVSWNDFASKSCTNWLVFDLLYNVYTFNMIITWGKKWKNRLSSSMLITFTDFHWVKFSV